HPPRIQPQRRHRMGHHPPRRTKLLHHPDPPQRPQHQRLTTNTIRKQENKMIHTTTKNKIQFIYPANGSNEFRMDKLAGTKVCYREEDRQDNPDCLKIYPSGSGSRCYAWVSAAELA